MRIRIRGGLLLALIFLTLGALGGYWMLQKLKAPFGKEQQQVVYIPLGSSSTRIGNLLTEAGILESPFFLRAALEFYPSERDLQAGRYQIQQPLSPLQILELLRSGRTQRRKITLREGLDIAETISLLVSHGLGSRGAFRSLAVDPQLIRDLDPAATNLEGFLFPETYLFESTASEEKIIGSLVEQLRRIWTPERKSRAQEIGMSLREVLTLASLIEKETGASEERKLVSSVFHNRLRRNMRLACDPTVIYAVKLVKEYDGIIHRSDLELDSPYNTYLYPGLPPGPIANPGLASIDAALQPAQSDYLYFVARNDGTHVFSKTYQEHSRAVQRYQR